MGKLKLYLDTNMIHDLFVRQATTLRDGSKLEKPKKFAFMLEHQGKFEFITSFLTKAEIMRELVSAHGLKPDRIEKFWGEFMITLKPRYIMKFTFDEQIVEIVSRVKMKLRTMVNFFHLFIAIGEDAYFVSGDKQIVEKIKEANVYDKLLDYIGLRQLAFNSHDSSCGES